jgi:hypothetical protein
LIAGIATRILRDDGVGEGHLCAAGERAGGADAGDEAGAERLAERGPAVELRFEIFEVEREVEHVGIGGDGGRGAGRRRGGRARIVVTAAGVEQRQRADGRGGATGVAQEVAAFGAAVGDRVEDGVGLVGHRVYPQSELVKALVEQAIRRRRWPPGSCR